MAAAEKFMETPSKFMTAAEKFMAAAENLMTAADKLMEAAEKLCNLSITAIFKFKSAIEGADHCKNQEIHSKILT